MMHGLCKWGRRGMRRGLCDGERMGNVGLFGFWGADSMQ